MISFFEPLFVGAIAIWLFAVVIDELMSIAKQLVKWLGGQD